MYAMMSKTHVASSKSRRLFSAGEITECLGQDSPYMLHSPRTDSVSMIRVLGYRTGRAEIGQGWFLALEASMVSSAK